MERNPKNRRLPTIRKKVNEGLKELGLPLIPDKTEGLKQLADEIEKNFPDVKVNRKKLSLATVPSDTAEGIFKILCKGVSKVPGDFDEHIYIHAPNVGLVYVPVRECSLSMDVKERNKIPMITINFNHYHMVDLGQPNLRREYKEYFTMRDCADYILRVNPTAREITLEEFSNVRNLRRLSPAAQGAEVNKPGEIETMRKTDREKGTKHEGKVFNVPQ